MVLQIVKGQGCCEGRCCCPALVTSIMFFYPDNEQEQVASTALTDAQQQKPIVEKGEGTDSATHIICRGDYDRRCRGQRVLCAS